MDNWYKKASPMWGWSDEDIEAVRGQNKPQEGFDISTLKQGDKIKYQMGPNQSVGPVTTVGREFIEVVDPSRRIVRVYPNQILGLA